MDIRYSKVDASDSSSANYLNKILFPAVSPNSYTNPGFSTFIYDTDKKEANSLKSTFLTVRETFNRQSTTKYNNLPWFDVDFTEKFAFESFSADSMASLVSRLSDDLPKAREFIFNKMGTDTTDDEQVKASLYAYKNCRLIGEFRTPANAFLQEADVHKTLCVMSESKTAKELRSCISSKIEEEFLQ